MAEILESSELGIKEIPTQPGREVKIDTPEPSVSTASENLPAVDINDTSSSTTHSVADDIKKFYETKSDKMKAELFERVYENEQLIFYQEHKRFMTSPEKKLLARQIQKEITKGLLVVDAVGKIRKRQSNITAPSKKKKRKK